MTFGSLFSGIGGLDLGLERAGLKCVWQVEINEYARRVLEKHWPGVRRWDDVRTFPPEGEWGCDLICGGFPCQDISNAGRRAGIEGEQSSLWGEFARIISVVRPRYVLVENVAALLGRGMGRVLGDLAECGYDAEWDCLPAAAFGALHIRNRVFLLAYAKNDWIGRGKQLTEGSEGKRKMANSISERLQGQRISGEGSGEGSGEFAGRAIAGSDSTNANHAISRRYGAPQETIFAGRGGIESSGWWESEPDVGRVAHGIPSRVDKLRGLGNAVVPQVAEFIGKRLLEAIGRESP